MGEDGLVVRVLYDVSRALFPVKHVGFCQYNSYESWAWLKLFYTSALN